MPGLSIDRLSLHLSGLSEGDGRRLTRLIADGLAAAAVPPTVENRNALESRITLHAGDSLQKISDEIVADLLRQLDRLV